MKKKNGFTRGETLAVDVILFCVIALCVFGAWCVVSWLAIDTLSEGMCFDISQSDFVMVGVEGHRDIKNDTPALLGALGAMALARVDGVPDDAVRHIDMAFYDGWRLQGTMLFWQVGMREWTVQVNDDLRGDCGVYRVGDDSVLMIMDGLR